MFLNQTKLTNPELAQIQEPPRVAAFVQVLTCIVDCIAILPAMVFPPQQPPWVEVLSHSVQDLAGTFADFSTEVASRQTYAPFRI